MGGMLQDDGSSVTSSSLEFFSMMSPNLSSSHPWLKELKPEERGLYLIHLLLSCANHVSNGSLENVNLVLEQISQLASPDGDTMQRIASYFAEAMAERILKSWPGMYKALNFTKIPLISEEFLAKKLFFELFPFLKLAFLVTNQSILESMEGEKMVHIIDLNASEPSQWIALIHALRARPDGPPHLRITGVHRHQEVLDRVANRLTQEADRLDLPFQFNSVVCTNLENLDVEKLCVKTGEALAISSVLQLHTLLGSSIDESKPNRRRSPSDDSTSLSSPNSSTKMDAFLNTMWGLSPKIVLITEQDCNHNSPGFMERFSEALYSYAALFDCLESTLPRTSIERRRVEKMVLGEEIKNIVSCEGRERRERHEKMEKWVQRMDNGGFGIVPFSYVGMMQARELLQGYGCDGYRVKQNGCVAVIAWQDRPLFSVSAWRCKRS